MNFVICHSSTATEPRNTSNQKLVSFKKHIKRKKLVTLHLKMKANLIALAEVYVQLVNHMNVKKYNTQNIHLLILNKNYLNQNKFSCFLYWINTCSLKWEKPLLGNMCITLMHNVCGRIFKNI